MPSPLGLGRVLSEGPKKLSSPRYRSTGGEDLRSEDRGSECERAGEDSVSTPLRRT
jgi:hypothetical protein